MKIVIDMQGIQSIGSRDRGIGRYTLSLSKAIVRNKGEHEIILVLNGRFPETIENVRTTFNELLPQKNICIWYVPSSVNSLDSCNEWRRKSAELVYEAFIESLEPDIVLVTSLFEGLIDDAVTSIGVFRKNIPTATILYDLIPLIHRGVYLKDSNNEAWYENKISHLRQANILLAISKSSGLEAINYLGFQEKLVTNISTASDPQFQPLVINEQDKIDIYTRYNLSGSFVMYTGGVDFRKNIEGLIKGYGNLPEAIRTKYQLVIVCSVPKVDKERLEKLARQYNYKKGDLILTGFVPENDLITLYNLCKVFVFPSLHEGFGLPALEAMSCGRAVIGSNVSSIPEVIGLEDALFNPKDNNEITSKLLRVLTDNSFREILEKHSVQQAKKFSWDKTAIKAIIAMKQCVTAQKFMPIKPISKPKMAFVSPLPPEQSGISNYSAELLPELSRHYKIDVIVEQDVISNPWINANCKIRNVKWFERYAKNYDRVIYHFGNSHFHTYMFGLLEKIPGVVVLHDFFLTGIVAQMEGKGLYPHEWSHELYQSHGYKALYDRFNPKDSSDDIWNYPCNISVLRKSLGLIVHSKTSQTLAKQWYSLKEVNDWEIIPLLRTQSIENKIGVRDRLKLNKDDFIICSFGIIGVHKMSHHLLKQWLISELAQNKNCIFIFVGKNDKGQYGEDILETIRNSGLSKQVRITGWVNDEIFKNYLSVTDIAIQLRSLSRGETSAAVLDCMNYGIPTIVNANGSMAELPDNLVWKLKDNFEDKDLVNAIETLWKDKKHRHKLGQQAKEVIHQLHAPRHCADQYSIAIERFHNKSLFSTQSLITDIAKIETDENNLTALLYLAIEMGRTFKKPYQQKQIFLDISTLVHHDAGTGIQRVVRNILKNMLINPPEGYRVEPVYVSENQGYLYARQFTLNFLNCPNIDINDDVVEYNIEDIFLGLDLQPHVVQNQKEFYQELRRHGVQVKFVVYDLLCVLMSQYFKKDDVNNYYQWLNIILESDGAVCISRSVADELRVWNSKKSDNKKRRPFKISWFHLGADIDNSNPSIGFPVNFTQILTTINQQNSFLMVGTIEPRKGHAQTLLAFEKLWTEGHNVNLVIVGKNGWMVDDLCKKIKQHLEIGKRLFWLPKISDECLEVLYQNTHCLIAASHGEGFGLPLIEAAKHNLPMIVRDIPVFCEVVGEYAYYFSGDKPDVLVETIKSWLDVYATGQHPRSNKMPWLTWKESMAHLLGQLLNN